MMGTISKLAGRLAFAVVMAAVGALATGDAFAAGVSGPSVAVPAPPGGPGGYSSPAGCYRVDQALYGPYYMSFCINGHSGTYRVRGGGLDCRGSLRANYDTFQVNISLHDTRCGRGMAWTADTLSCQMTGPAGDFLNAPSGLNAPSVAVPAPPPTPHYSAPAALRCNYQPAVAGYPAMTIIAQRTN